jgi:hypothetical protein
MQPNCLTSSASVVLSGLPTGNWTINPGAYTGSSSTTTISGLAALLTYNFTVTNDNGCTSDTAAVVAINAQLSTPTVTITNPAAVIAPATVDITTPDITAGSLLVASFSYWTNLAGTIPYTTPTTATAGTYYIKGTSVAGCSDIKPVVVTVTPLIPTCDSVAYVSNNNNSGAGSLREAISRVCDYGIVRFNLAVDGQTILLTTGTLTIDKNVKFDNNTHTLGVTINGVGDNITILAGKSLTLLSGSKITVLGTINNVSKGNAGLVIASGASLIQNNINLPATVQRYLTGAWHLFGSPFKKNAGAAVGNLLPSGGSVQAKPYIGGTNWDALITSATYQLTPTVGYAVKPNVSFTTSLTGKLYYSPLAFDYTNSLVYTGSGASQSWNLLANPYTAYLNWNLLGLTNVASTLYLWDNTLFPNSSPVASTSYLRTYNSCNNVGVPANTKPFIAPLQGFFVKAVYSSPKLAFTPSARTHATSSYYKDFSNNEILLRLKTETDEGIDELVICKNSDSKLDFERFDSEKLFNDLPVAMYSQSTTGEKLIINSINTTNNTIIPLGIIGNTGKKAKITAFGLETAEQAYLEDRMMGKLISLSENTTYEFEFPTDVITGRFFIRFGNNNAVLSSSDVKVFENDNLLNIVAQTGEELQEVEVFTVTGARVFKAEIGKTNVYVNELQLAPAIYLVRVKTSISTQNIKLNWK